MRAGSLRHRITIEERDNTANAAGQRLGTWTTFATRWASIEPAGGSEAISNDQIKATTTHRIRCRHVAGLTNQHRVVFGARTFDVRSVRNLDERRKEIEIDAVENL